MDTVGQSASYLGWRMESAQDGNGCDRRPGERWSDVVGNPSQADDLDVHLLSRCLQALELRLAPVLQAKGQRAPRHSEDGIPRFNTYNVVEGKLQRERDSCPPYSNQAPLSKESKR